MRFEARCYLGHRRVPGFVLRQLNKKAPACHLESLAGAFDGVSDVQAARALE